MSKYDSYFKVGDVLTPKPDAELEFHPSWQDAQKLQKGVTVAEIDTSPCTDDDGEPCNLQTLFFEEIPYISAGFNYVLKS